MTRANIPVGAPRKPVEPRAGTRAVMAPSGIPDAGVTFRVEGKPYSKPRPVVTSNGTYYRDHRGYERWQTDVQASLIEALGYKPEPDGRNYKVKVGFQLRGHPRQDLDNLIGSILDALNGIVWLDDVQVVALHTWKTTNHPAFTAFVEITPRLAQ